MATHSSILAWKIPQTAELGRLQSMGWQRAGHDWAHTCTHVCIFSAYLNRIFSAKCLFCVKFFSGKRWGIQEKQRRTWSMLSVLKDLAEFEGRKSNTHTWAHTTQPQIHTHTHTHTHTPSRTLSVKQRCRGYMSALLCSMVVMVGG